MKEYDVVVIGAGSGGLVVASGAASFGFKVALIEKNKLGGDCLWTGCVPTKSLIGSAKIAHMIDKYSGSNTSSFDFAEAKRRMKKAMDKIAVHDSIERFEKMGVDVYIGFGEIKTANQILVNGEILSARKIVIATGSSPFVPVIEGLDEAGYMTNEEALKLEKLPKSISIIGSGAIGVEFAQIFNRFGVEVNLIGRSDRIIEKEDEEISRELQEIFKSEGVNIYPSMNIIDVSLQNGDKVIRMSRTDGREMKISSQEIMVATGRRANTKNLGIENTNIKLDRGYIVTDEYMRTDESSIYAIGDVNGKMQFTHVAGYEAKAVLSTMFFKFKTKVDYENIPFSTYTDPEVFHLGLTEAQAREKYGQIKVYKTRVEDVDRFIADNKDDGFIKIICDVKGHIIGAHGLCEDSSSLMEEIVYAKKNKDKIGKLSRIVYPYPAKTEIVRNTSDLFWREKMEDGKLKKLVKAYLKMMN